MQPKISILIPCYNSEKYLSQCINSVVNQSLKNIEILVINDGSTDSTLDIIKQFADKDNRIKIIDKPNEGYGKSMNRGLDAATGEYVGIVEGDDWVDADMFETLVKIADKHDADVVKGDFYEYTTKNGEKNVRAGSLPSYDCGRVIKPRRETAIFWCAPSIWAGIYRRDFLNKYGIRFLESSGASYQDTGFNFKVWAMAERAFLTTDAFLHYRCDNANSSVKSSGKIFCVCDEWDEVERFLTQYPEIHQGVAKLIPNVKLGTYMWNMGRLTDDAKQQFIKRFQSEYTKYLRDGDFDKSYLSDKQYYKIMMTIFPKSLKYRILKIFFDVIGPVYKTRVKNCTRIYYVFSKIPVFKKRLHQMRGVQ